MAEKIKYEPGDIRDVTETPAGQFDKFPTKGKKIEPGRRFGPTSKAQRELSLKDKEVVEDEEDGI